MLIWRERANLWTLITPPAVWAVHFLVCYVAAAVLCAKGGMATDFTIVRATVLGATVPALVFILLAGIASYRRWGLDNELPPYDEPTSEHQESFLGIATFLVCGLSFIGVIFVAMPAIFISDCR
jgi:hypothetical protein